MKLLYIYVLLQIPVQSGFAKNFLASLYYRLIEDKTFAHEIFLTSKRDIPSVIAIVLDGTRAIVLKTEAKKLGLVFDMTPLKVTITFYDHYQTQNEIFNINPVDEFTRIVLINFKTKLAMFHCKTVQIWNGIHDIRERHNVYLYKIHSKRATGFLSSLKGLIFPEDHKGYFTVTPKTSYFGIVNGRKEGYSSFLQEGSSVLYASTTASMVGIIYYIDDDLSKVWIVNVDCFLYTELCS